MPVYSSQAAAPSFGRAVLALVVTVLALGGALLGAVLLATGALLTVGLRALGIGRRAPAPAQARNPGNAAPGVIEGEYRVIESPRNDQP